MFEAPKAAGCWHGIEATSKSSNITSLSSRSSTEPSVAQIAN